MDLENFPTREMAKDMMGMISPIYDNSYVAKWIFEVMSVSLALARQTVDDLMNEAFPETTSWAISMWEQEYGITPNESLSIEDRRKALTQKRNYRRPMNPWRIEQLVKEICNRDVQLKENVEPHTYEIIIGEGDNEIDLDAVYNAVYKVKQSQKHVRIVYETVVGVRIRAEPTGVVFPYPLAGTKPYPYNVGSADSASLILDTEDAGAVYPIVPTGRAVSGTVPGRSYVGSLDDVSVAAAISEDSATFPYIPAGVATAGTKPDVAVVSSVNTPGISAAITDVSAGIVYKVCGAKRLS